VTLFGVHIWGVLPMWQLSQREDGMAKSDKPATKENKPDDLLKTSKEGKIELTEDELKKVSGGDKSSPNLYDKIT
jgi:bacteriocin-like protein